MQNSLNKLKPIVIAICGALTVFGCGGGDGGSVGTSSVAIPVEAANSPLIGVLMRVDCANGASGTGTVGTTSSPGVGTITVSGSCTAPIKITAIGGGKMRPIGAKADGSEDLVYDPASNLPLSGVMTTLPNADAPAQVNPITTLVAEKTAPNGTSLASLAPSTVTAAQATIAAALGLDTSDLTQDYRNPKIAAASTLIAEVATLAAARVATNGMPDTVTSQTTLGLLIAQGLSSQASAALPNGMITARQIASAIKAIDAKLDATASTTALSDVDTDNARVYSLVNTAQSAATATSLADISDKAARAVADAAAAGSAGTSQQQQLVTAASARMKQAATEAIQAASSRMVTDVTTTAGIPDAAVQIAKKAAAEILADYLTALTQAGAKPADLAAQAKAVADTVAAAIKSDTSGTIKSFRTSPAIGNANIAAILVGQATSATGAVTATSSTGFNVDSVAANALKIARALKDVDSSYATTPAQQAAFIASINAVAAKLDPNSITDSSVAPASLSALLNSMTNRLAPLIGDGTSVDDRTEALAEQAARLAIQSALGSASTFNLATPPASSSVVFLNTLEMSAGSSSSGSSSSGSSSSGSGSSGSGSSGSGSSGSGSSGSSSSTPSTTPYPTPTPTPAFSGICQVSFGSVTAFVTDVPSASSCSGTVIGFDGTTATVTAVSTALSGKTSRAWTALASCDPLGAPPAAGASTATPCKM